MIHNFKKFKLPLFCFLVVFILSFWDTNPHNLSIIAHYFFITGLLSFTITNIEQIALFKSQRTLQMAFLISFLVPILLNSLLTFTIHGSIQESNYVLYIFSLILFNILFYLIHMDWKSENNMPNFIIYILKLIGINFILFLIYLVLGIALSKEPNASLSNRLVSQRIIMGISPILHLLIIPHFHLINRRRVSSLINALPVLFTIILLINLIVYPTPFKKRTFINFLEKKGLYHDHQLQPKITLNIQERAEIVDYSQQMIDIPLPDSLAPIQNYSRENYYNDAAEIDFIQATGFSPETLLSSDDITTTNQQDMYQFDMEQTAQNKLLEGRSQYTQTYYFSLSQSLLEKEEHTLETNRHVYSLEDSVFANPDQYVITLKDNEGQIVKSIKVFDIIQSLLEKNTTQIPFESAVFPFENNDISGYLAITSIVYEPHNKDTLITLNVGIEKINQTENQVTLQNDQLIIDGPFQQVVYFEPKMFDRDHLLNRTIFMNSENYKLMVKNIVSTEPEPFNITITKNDQTMFERDISTAELTDFLLDDYEQNFQSKTYQDGNFEVTLLIHDAYNRRFIENVSGYLFINKIK